MKNLKTKKIYLKKITIANIEAKSIYGGFVSPTGITEDEDCINTITEYEQTECSFIEP